LPGLTSSGPAITLTNSKQVTKSKEALGRSFVSPDTNIGARYEDGDE
jgi:hypothetical protein